MSRIKKLLFGLIALCVYSAEAQVSVDVNLDTKHTVGNVSSFDRSKFMTVHASLSENDLNGEDEMLKYLMEDLDLYFGRETGTMAWSLRNISEDPNRSGYADPSVVTSFGTRSKNSYATSANTVTRHKYESRQILMTASQDRYYPGSTEPLGAAFLNSRDANIPIWQFGTQAPFGKTLGEYMGRWVRDFHRPESSNNPLDGRAKPKWVEVMNEPVWPLHDEQMHGGATIEDIFTMHNNVADEIKKYSPNTQVGGFTTAFPEFEVDNFGQWNNRWKKFIDMSGDKMDFYSFHLYDFPGIARGKEKYRKGANNEATMDMIDHYGALQGKRKKFLISEYGSQLHDWYNQPWSPFRDWLCIKAFNSMLMQFLERPDRILGALPFTPLKAEWGRNSATVPYYWRLMRRANEPQSNSGDWVWSDQIKFYELWSKVKGTRVDSKQNNINIQTDAYVNGTKAFIILNNLEETAQQISLNLKGTNGRTVTNVLVKRLFLQNNAPVLVSGPHTFNLNSSLTMQPDETIILEYTFNGAINVNQNSNEAKYFATTYNQAINANQNKNFTFVQKFTKAANGEAVLRLGIGRAKNLSRRPTISVNGTQINYAGTIYRGDDQADRDAFFGVLEIPVPYNLLKSNANNVFTVKFNDGGGRVSSVALQVFHFSKNLRGSTSSDIMEGEFYIENRATGKRLRTNGSATNFINLELVPNTWNGEASQWEMVAATNGYFYLQNKANGKFIRPLSSSTDPAGEANGNNIVHVPNTYRGSFTQWKKVNTTDGYFYLQNRATGMYFRPENGDTFSTMQQRPTSWGGAWTQWKFQSVTGAKELEVFGPQNEESFEPKLFPNPVQGSEFSIVTGGQKATIEIFDISGRLMLNARTEGNDIETFSTNIFTSNGLYYVRVSSASTTKTLKVIVNKN